MVSLLAREHEVVAVVRGHSSPAGTTQSVRLDLGERGPYAGLPPSVDALVHLAQSTEYRNFPDGMRDMVAVNVQATAELLEYARQANCRHFILASTGSVYDSRMPMAEDAPVQPRSPYAVSKYCAELLLRPYEDLLSCLCLRLFFLYGPGQHGMLISRLAERLRRGEPVTIQGREGGMRFCPTYVDDVAKVIASALPNRVAGLVNVASPQSLTLKDAVGTMARTLGVEPRFSYDDDAQPPVFAPELARLATWFDVRGGFRSFREGIEDTFGR